MGLIKATLAGVGSTLADTWKEYFCCESMSPEVLAVKGVRKTGKKSSNTKGNDNIITNGSVIVVNEGQCMIIVDQGQIVEICAVPGEYTYDMSTEPSIFDGGLTGIKETFKTMGRRISFGGTAPHDQRIYYFNVKEITDNKFGTPTPVPFRVNYQDLGRSFTVGLRCNGIYSYKIVDPLLFYTNVCGNISTAYTRSQLDNTLHGEFMSQLQPAFAKLSNTLTYDQLPYNTLAITSAMKEIFKSEWRDTRGIEIQSVAIRSVSLSKEDEDRIKKYEDIAWNRDPLNAAAKAVEAQNDAMVRAAGNSGGAAMGMFGMNMAQQAGGMNAQSLFSMASQQQQKNDSVAPDSWRCSCGTENRGKFCANCGKPKPDMIGWTCECGKVNKGKFCEECGKPKPAGIPLYKCDKCGWEPEDPKKPPKFCPECGDPFGDEDIVSK